jgi:hypothetical protein
MHCLRLAAAAVFAAATGASSGCDVLFRLDEVRDAGSGGTGDGPAGDTGDAGDPPIDALQLTCPPSGELELPLVADTTLFTSPLGAFEVLIGRGSFRVLATFDLMGLPITSITSLELRLQPAVNAHGCSAASPNQCEPCEDTTGSYIVYLSNPDWDELQATSSNRTAADPWEQVNATGPTDRVAPFTATYVRLNPFVHTRPFAASTLPAAWDRTRISFHLEPSGGGAFFQSKESQSCGSAIPPRLIVNCLPSSQD